MSYAKNWAETLTIANQDCYTPRGSIDLRQVAAVLPSKSRTGGFKLVTHDRKKQYRFLTDT